MLICIPMINSLLMHELTSRCSCVCVAVEALTFPPSTGKSFIMGADEALENELGLGELAGLTVANEAESLAYDVSTTLY